MNDERNHPSQADAEERARELMEGIPFHSDLLFERLTALLTRVQAEARLLSAQAASEQIAVARLEEAKWWDFRIRREGEATTETIQRIVALEAAAAPAKVSGSTRARKDSDNKC